MNRALLSVAVWRDSGPSAVITVYQEGRRVDRVIVIPGDDFDLELEEGMHAVLAMTPLAEEAEAVFAAERAVLDAELEEAG